MSETIWVIVGFVGQALFTGRFAVQWIASEWKKESTIPVAFWFLSIGGGVILLAYVIYRRDPVLIVGQSFGVVVYVRNLMLIKRRKAKESVLS